MQIEPLSQYGIPQEYIEKLKQQGIAQLYDPQIKSIKKGLFDSKNQIISAPTASGKTLIATLSAIKKISEEKCRVIYLVPLISLASEKFQYYRKLFSGTGIKVAISTGDLDSSSQWLSNYDFIILTTEKCDSLMRHGVKWINDVGLIIADEIHMLQDPSRGPTLEITLTRLREVVPQAQILALSATVKNAKEIAEWLIAETVISDFRPVELHEGIYFDSKLQFFGKNKYELNEQLTPEVAILDNTKNMRKQALYFVSTRRNAESLAEKLGEFNKNFLGKNEKQELSKLSEEVKNVLEVPTRQCKKLAECIRNGAAFHHAGLLGKQKELIEDSFRNGLINSIIATPTLAMGVNLPAFRVIVRDAKRYYSGYGARFIPVLEYKQFCGRAGRPEYDSFGESILIAKSEDEAYELTERFILGEPEEIHSKLALEPVLRMHTLALIASGFVNRQDSLFEFFGKTFYAYQYGDIGEIQLKIQDILNTLIKFEFIVEKGKRLYPTRIGKRVSELYTDPLTAHRFIQSLKIARKKKPRPFSYLHMIADTLEMRPLLSVRNREFEEVNNVITRETFLQKVPEEWDLRFDDFLKSVKTAMMLEAWMNELTEDQILSKYKVTPGDLRTRLRNADWLLYSTNEIALLLGFKDLLTNLRKIRIRMKYGVKEELIPLVRLEQIGRVRGRKLWSSNLRTLNDLRKIPTESLARIVGPKVATIIKKQLGRKVEKIKEEKQENLSRFEGK